MPSKPLVEKYQFRKWSTASIPPQTLNKWKHKVIMILSIIGFKKRNMDISWPPLGNKWRVPDIAYLWCRCDSWATRGTCYHPFGWRVGNSGGGSWQLGQSRSFYNLWDLTCRKGSTWGKVLKQSTTFWNNSDDISAFVSKKIANSVKWLWLTCSLVFLMVSSKQRGHSCTHNWKKPHIGINSG